MITLKVVLVCNRIMVLTNMIIGVVVSIMKHLFIATSALKVVLEHKMVYVVVALFFVRYVIIQICVRLVRMDTTFRKMKQVRHLNLNVIDVVSLLRHVLMLVQL